MKTSVPRAIRSESSSVATLMPSTSVLMPGDLGAAELVVLQVDVVDDFRDGAKRGIFQCAALEQHFERALVALVRELGLEHVEAQFARMRAIPLAGYEFESSLRIDKAADQPGAGDAIHIDALPCDPGPVAQRAECTFRRNRCSLCSSRPRPRLILSPAP